MKLQYSCVMLSVIFLINSITGIDFAAPELISLRNRLLKDLDCIATANIENLDIFYKNKKVLVTGGAGFIGSHLVDVLLRHGAKVTVLDDLSTGFLNNLSHNRHKINFIQDSITNFAICENACLGQDIVFHCAAMVLVAESESAPHKCNEVNCLGTFNILSAAHKAGCQSVIFSSSAAAYGSRSGKFNEEDDCYPSSIYGLSKLLGEHYCRLFSRIYNLGTVCLRYFNVFGSRQRTNSPYCGAIALFNKKMQDNEPVIIYGDGEQTRDFVPVDIVVRANLLAGALPKKDQKGQAINVGLGHEISINQLVKIMSEEFPTYKENIQYQESRLGDVRHSVADNRRLLELFSVMNHPLLRTDS